MPQSEQKERTDKEKMKKEPVEGKPGMFRIVTNKFPKTERRSIQEIFEDIDETSSKVDNKKEKAKL